MTGGNFVKKIDLVTRSCSTWVAARWAEPDKQLHVRWSFWLTLAAHLFWPLHWAVLMVVLIGLAKEGWDHYYGSGLCFADLLSNFIGIIAAVYVISLLPTPAFG